MHAPSHREYTGRPRIWKKGESRSTPRIVRARRRSDMLRPTMKGARRKRLLSIGTIGTLLTLLVLLTDALGGLDIPEQQLHDLRARSCQFFTSPPTDRIAHVDIDDGALDQVGRWPWSRTRIAELIDEMNVAGAKLIVLDVL